MKRMLFLALAAAVFSTSATAIEYRAINEAAVLYDTPSQRGSKLFVIHRDTPVEVVVNIEGWAKVRDSSGGLAWIEKKYLADKRMVIVTADRAEVRKKADEASPLSFEAEKKVALEYLDTAPGGWIHVRHRDGPSGFVRASQLWGY